MLKVAWRQFVAHREKRTLQEQFSDSKELLTGFFSFDAKHLPYLSRVIEGDRAMENRFYVAKKFDPLRKRVEAKVKSAAAIRTKQFGRGIGSGAVPSSALWIALGLAPRPAWVNPRPSERSRAPPDGT